MSDFADVAINENGFLKINIVAGNRGKSVVDRRKADFIFQFFADNDMGKAGKAGTVTCKQALIEGCIRGNSTAKNAAIKATARFTDYIALKILTSSIEAGRRNRNSAVKYVVIREIATLRIAFDFHLIDERTVGNIATPTVDVFENDGAVKGAASEGSDIGILVIDGYCAIKYAVCHSSAGNSDIFFICRILDRAGNFGCGAVFSIGIFLLQGLGSYFIGKVTPPV